MADPDEFDDFGESTGPSPAKARNPINSTTPLLLVS